MRGDVTSLAHMPPIVYLRAGRVEYYPESVRSYVARRRGISLALIYVWLFVALILFWVWRDTTGAYPNLTVPPFGSVVIHFACCLSVVIAYVIGTAVVPRHTTLGLRPGALPSLVRAPRRDTAREGRFAGPLCTARHELRHSLALPHCCCCWCAAAARPPHALQPVHELVRVEQVRAAAAGVGVEMASRQGVDRRV